MRKIFKSLLLVCVFLIMLTCLPILVHAAPGDPGCDPLEPSCPIDGGLGLLLAAGVGYGIKKVRHARKKQITIPHV